MPIISSRVTVTAAVTEIVQPTHGSANDSIAATIRNPGPVSVFVGGAFVTSAAGFEILPGGVMDVNLIAGDVLYGVTASGSQELHVMRLRQ